MKFGFMEFLYCEKTPRGRRPRTIRVLFSMRNYFLTLNFAIPTSGCRVRSNASAVDTGPHG